MQKTIKIIDLFAGIGGIRLGVTQACEELGYQVECLLTAEIKKPAIASYYLNYEKDPLVNITKVDADTIPDFDILCAGFPCQPFSMAGKKLGFADTRGTLFFEIERILKAKKPKYFILENVKGLVTHNKINAQDKEGETLKVILNNLQLLGYNVKYKVLNSKNFGLAMNRERVFIVGALNQEFDLEFEIPTTQPVLKDILETTIEPKTENVFSLQLKKAFGGNLETLAGTQFKDKAVAKHIKHSWEFAMRGSVNQVQALVLDYIAVEYKRTPFFTLNHLQEVALKYNMLFKKEDLQDLIEKRYLQHKEKGITLVCGMLSFKFNMILDRNKPTPTIIATEAAKLGVIEHNQVRSLTALELKRLFGYPEDYKIIENNAMYDLFGNTVTPPVLKAITLRLLNNDTDQK